MPPLPQTFDAPTTAALEALGRRAQDMRTFQLPRLRACNDSLAAQQALAAELREDVEGFARGIDALELAIPDQRGEPSRRALAGTVHALRDDLAKLRKDLRAATLASKRAIDARAQTRREELLRSAVLREKREERATDDVLMRAQNDVTEALQRTVGLMQGELEKSVLSTQMLDESSANLRSAGSAHSSLALVMGTSKQLITALERSDWLDRLLILAGLAVFALTAAFILKQRILDRGLRIAFWWTRFLPGASLGGLLSDEGLDAAWKGAVSAEAGSASLVSASATAASVLSTVAAVVGSSSIAPEATAAGEEDVAQSIIETLGSELGESSTVVPVDVTQIPVEPSGNVRDEL